MNTAAYTVYLTDPTRVAVLRDRRAEVVEDCQVALDDCDKAELEGAVRLTKRVVDALVGGHHEAAMALAVSVAEPLAMWASQPRVRAWHSRDDKTQWEKHLSARSKYRHAQDEIDRLGTGPVDFWDFNYQVLIAPIPSFFTGWKPGSATPQPALLSRHLVAHLAPREHFTQENALLALMLDVSILREQQEWTHEVHIDDAMAEMNRVEFLD